MADSRRSASRRLIDMVHDQLFDLVPFNVAVIDRDFNIVEANRTFFENYGEWHDRPCYTVYKGRTERCDHCTAARSFSDGQVHVNEEEGIPRDGQQTYYFVQMLPLVRDTGDIPYIIEMSTDITTTKLLEKEKERLKKLVADLALDNAVLREAARGNC